MLPASWSTATYCVKDIQNQNFDKKQKEDKVTKLLKYQ